MSTIDLRPHQRAAVDQLDNGKILNGGVGSGKSRAAVAYYLEKEAPKDVYVITTAKKRDSLDWPAEFIRGGVSVHDDTTSAGVLRVDSWNNISKYTDVRDAFFIFDEQRLVGSGAWVKSFYAIAKHNNWILLSATPGDNWLDYFPVFKANGFYSTKSEFSARHVVWKPYSKFPKVLRYTDVGHLVQLKNSLLVEMPFERHTTRHTHIIDVDYDRDLFRKVLKDRWHVYEERPLRDVAELFSVMRKVVNTHSSRISALKELLMRHPRVIVFYNFNYELEMLRKMLSADSRTAMANGRTAPTTQLLGSRSSGEESETKKTGSKDFSIDLAEWEVAEWNGHKHEEVPQTDKWVYFVQYAAGAEGWNCTSTDALCFFSLTYSYKHWEQAYGRIDRLNTPYDDLHYYVLKSDSYIDKAIWSALKDKKSFNLADFAANDRQFAKN